MEVANTLAYYDTATMTAVKSFIVQAPKRTQSLHLVHMTNFGATPSTSNLFQNDWLAFRQNVGLTKRPGVTRSSAFLRKAFLKEKPFGKVNHSLFASLVCLSVFLSVCPYVWPPVCQPACMPASLTHMSFRLYVGLSIQSSVSLSISLSSAYRSACLPVKLFYLLSVCLSICPPACVSVSPSYLSVCLSVDWELNIFLICL